MLIFRTPTAFETVTGVTALGFDDDAIALDGDPIYIDGGSETLSGTILAADVIVSARRFETMALHPRFPYTYHVGESGTAFAIQVRNRDGSARTDIASATFKLVNVANGATLIDDVDCDTVVDGILSYTPTALDMATACRFRAQYTCTLTNGLIVPSFIVEGEIESSL